MALKELCLDLEKNPDDVTVMSQPSKHEFLEYRLKTVKPGLQTGVVEYERHGKGGSS